ncbi:DSBA oxidoreductase [Microbacterium sorbitolivorans]|uniref:DsbA family oxidoreductase n=1 Tax=Microbacterium sorbitolivorans TaxID=1867410 RepID=A0A367Y0Q4_9MICO|nr:DsbA family oxidoreductase [Microbacterium sorbitolivorans]RCK58632.1 DsbA family oxidoreductase [Microbacterium sorbitolivorans]GGF38082.1 DSBA oxidoreductase [Microbacterium sorbitolivorans]
MTDTTPAPLGIDIWLDVACPWCLLGERRLDAVIDKLPFGENVDVRYHSYQLDPTAPETTTMTQTEYLTGRGLDPKMLEQSHQHLDAGAAELDFEFNHDDVVPANTFTAHRLIQAAAAQGIQRQVVDALFLGYFQNGLNVGDHEALKKVVVDAGLSAEAADEVLADPAKHADDVKGDIAQAAQLGIRGVPFYVIDGRYGVSGAQPAEVFEQALTQVYDELNPKPALNLMTPDGEVCGPDGCAV